MGMYAVGKLVGGFLKVREGFVGLEEGQEAFTEAEVCCGGGGVSAKRFLISGSGLHEAIYSEVNIS